MREIKVTARGLVNGNFSKAVIPFRRYTASREMWMMQPFRERGMQRLVNDQKAYSFHYEWHLWEKGSATGDDDIERNKKP